MACREDDRLIEGHPSSLERQPSQIHVEQVGPPEVGFRQLG
jgi:hypothetical protein